ncbi:MAG: DUF3656 domain-containing protein, partial [Candidatus Pacebacteria bacterium]|nr:DUF3656 domain-containing protein [Candidatus Paceibacterota bacterium]
KNNDLKGSNVVRVEGEKIFLNEKQDLRLKDKIYRNYDLQFDKNIRAKEAFKRKIGLKVVFRETQKGFFVSFSNSENIISKEVEIKKEFSLNKEKALENIKTQFSKLGNSDFYLKEIKINFYNKPLFIPSSLLNNLRRELIEEINSSYIYKREERELKKDSKIKYYLDKLSYEYNISNKLAENFYKKHGVKEIDKAFEIKEGEKLMTTKHCLKYFLGQCQKQDLKEPLYLINEKGQRFLLKFDCKKCQMEIYKNNP